MRVLPPLSDEALSFRPHPEDFVVEELLPFDLSGDGEHLWLKIEKTMKGTPALVAALRRTYKLKENEIGIAGRKDAAGVTRQWVSVPARRVDEPERLESAGPFRVVESGRHLKKLRLGAHSGNLFKVRLRCEMDAAELQDRMAGLEQGFPNYFGHQRFGENVQNLEEAAAFVGRARRPRGRRERFLISVIQSALFNLWLHHRIKAGLFSVPLLGDWMMAEGKSAPRPFLCEDLARSQTEVGAGVISVAGPLVGQKLRPPHLDAMTWESRIWEEAGVPMEALCAHPSFDQSAMRSSRVLPGGVEISHQRAEIRVSFTLPPGAYATVFLREIVGRPLKDEAGRDASANP
jgi:tRNA pseudouridine13 synthase